MNGKRVSDGAVARLGIVLVFLCITSSCAASTKWVTVRHVIDGDTIVLENNQRVRLVGIDAPEIKSSHNPQAEHYGEESKEFLRQLIEGKQIRLEGEASQLEYDQYGRRLAYIFSEDKVFINRELVRLGYVQAVRHFPYKYKEEFLLLENEAKGKFWGMWAR